MKKIILLTLTITIFLYTRKGEATMAATTHTDTMKYLQKVMKVMNIILAMFLTLPSSV